MRAWNIASVHHDIYIILYFSFKLDPQKRKYSKSMLIYAYVAHVIQYVADRYAFRYNFYKKMCHAFFYAGTIQLFHVRFSLSSGSDTMLQIGQPRANFISAYEFLFYFRSANEPSADEIHLFLLPSVFIHFFFFKRTTRISDAMTRLI